MNTFIPKQEEINALDIAVENYFKNLIEIPIVESFYNSKDVIRKTSFIKLAVINDNDPIPDYVKNVYYDCKYSYLSKKRYIFYYINEDKNEKSIEYFKFLEKVNTIGYNVFRINKLKQYPRANYALCMISFKNNNFEIIHTPLLTNLFIGLCIINNSSFKILQSDEMINKTISKLNITKEEYIKNMYTQYHYQFLGDNVILNYYNDLKKMDVFVNNNEANKINFNLYFPFLSIMELTSYMENLGRMEIILSIMKLFAKRKIN